MTQEQYEEQVQEDEADRDAAAQEGIDQAWEEAAEADHRADADRPLSLLAVFGDALAEGLNAVQLRS